MRLILCRDGLFIAGMRLSVVNLKLENTFLIPSEWCMTELVLETSAKCSIGEKSGLARINPAMGFVVAAWGVDQRLQQRALDCVNFLNDHIHIHGYCKGQGLYYHPKKREGDWLLYILEHWQTWMDAD